MNRKKYYGPFHALFVISQEEKKSVQDSIFSVLYSPTNLLPSIAYYSISAMLRFSSIYFIESNLGLDSTFSPLMYKLSQICCLGVEALLLSPMELARKRLFAQKLGPCIEDSSKRPLMVDSSVQLHNEPYTGVLNCMISVIEEEGKPDRPKKPKNISKADWIAIHGEENESPATTWTTTKGYWKGFKSLFRGFWPRYASILVLFISDEISKEDQW